MIHGIFPYINGSASARLLADKLGTNVLYNDARSRFIGRPDKAVINWGSSNLSAQVLKCDTVFNRNDVGLYSNKLSAFIEMDGMEGVVTVPWTSEFDDAYDWYEEGSTVVARNKLAGHSGEGIEIVEPGGAYERDEFPDAPLYTKYIRKQDEYRIHFAFGSIIHIQRKGRLRDVDDPNWKVRNRAGGFAYCGVGIEDVPSHVINNAGSLIEQTSLDFGAIDIIYNKRLNMSYILEVNTAPGLAETVATKYARVFKEYAHV